MRRIRYPLAVFSLLLMVGVRAQESLPVVPASAPAEKANRVPARNVVIFIADGLRRGSVNGKDTPTLFALRSQGVDFANSHSLFPTFTTPNASAIATGHYLGDTGDFSNTVFTGFPVFDDGNFGRHAGSNTPFIEDDQVLGDIDDHIAQRNYLNEESLLALARRSGYRTAAIGKLGPVGIQDVSQLNPEQGAFRVPETLILDDRTGDAAGVPLPPDVRQALTAAGLPLVPPARVQPAGNVAKAGALVSNAVQQQFFADATTRAVLPLFRASGKPFVLVYWSRDPDGSQHNQGDSLNRLFPGINGPTSVAGVADADANLRQILEAIRADPALSASTDVFVTSDHGFATVSKHETDRAGGVADSPATRFTYRDAKGEAEVLPGWLPPGFLAIDLALTLDLPLFDPDSQAVAGQYQRVDPRGVLAGARQRPASGNGLLGGSGRVQARPDARVVVAANGGSDLIYLPRHDPALLQRIVHFLVRQSYVGALFVHSSYGPVAGTLPLSSVGLEGSAQLPTPTLAVAFRSFALDPSDPLQSAIQIADTGLQEGQGMHGSFGRDNTLNNMVAVGPDFKAGYVDVAPVSNADIARTIAHVLGLTLPTRGHLQGRVLDEALAGGPQAVPFTHAIKVSVPAAGGLATALDFQSVAGTNYFDAACLIDVRRRDPRATSLCY